MCEIEPKFKLKKQKHVDSPSSPDRSSKIGLKEVSSPTEPNSDHAAIHGNEDKKKKKKKRMTKTKSKTKIAKT